MSVRPPRLLQPVLRRQADQIPRFALTYLTTRFSRVARTRRARLPDTRADGVVIFQWPPAGARCRELTPYPSSVSWRLVYLSCATLEAFMVLDPDGRPCSGGSSSVLTYLLRVLHECSRGR